MFALLTKEPRAQTLEEFMGIKPATSSLGSYRHCLVARRIKHLERVTQGRMCRFRDRSAK
jgi:hypothetical protein